MPNPSSVTKLIMVGTSIAALVLFAVVAVNSYEFNDPVFNKYLADDLEDIQNSLTSQIHGRSRRDVEDHIDKCRFWKKRHLCCAEGTVEVHRERDRHVRKECYKEIYKNRKDGEFDPFKCDKVDRHRRDMTCLVQCVGQKNNILDFEGNVKEDEVKEHIKESMSKESWFSEVQEQVIETCLKESKSVSNTSTSQSCNPAGLKLVHCLFREIQLGCPQDQIKDEKSCMRAREKIKKHNGLAEE